MDAIRVIEEIRSIIQELIQEELLPRGEITTFRQDEFDVTLRWEHEGLSRNLHIWFMPVDEVPYNIAGWIFIEGNAWVDIGSLRRWTSKLFRTSHFIDRKGPIFEEEEKNALKRHLIEAYEQIRGWTVDDCERRAPLR